MSRRMAAAALAAAALVLPAGRAGADHCSSNSIYVFSRVGVDTPLRHVHNPTVTPEAVGCTLGEESLDTRIIYPGSNEITVRWFGGDFGEGTSLTGHVSGLGADTDIVLTRTPLTGGGFVYDSPDVPIDPLASGELVVRVNLPDDGDPTTDDFETDVYRTLN